MRLVSHRSQRLVAQDHTFDLGSFATGASGRIQEERASLRWSLAARERGRDPLRRPLPLLRTRLSSMSRHSAVHSP